MRADKIKRGSVYYYKSRNEYVKVISKADSYGNFYLAGSADGWCHASELRPLTKKERSEA